MLNFKKCRSYIKYSLIPASGLILYNYYTQKTQKYSYDEVSRHNNENDLWVTHKNNVYDITDFIDKHPGGKDNLIMVAGDSIDYYWNIYKQHNTEYVTNLLEKYKIGELEDYKKEEVFDEYGDEPIRDLENHIVHKNEPFNAEKNPEFLLADYITKEKDWFTRNHHSVPDINGDAFVIVINGTKFKYPDILKMKQETIISTIQCAGNRRSELNNIEKTMGLPWQGGAISNGKWAGVWLHDIIDIPKDKKYINIYDYDQRFSISLPINAGILLATKLNNEILTRDRGYPIRVVAPGYAGSKNVKWVEKIEFSDIEVDSSWQTGIAYKKFGNDIKSLDDISLVQKKYTPTVEMLPVQSYICSKKIVNNKIELRGYSISGGGRAILAVEISKDGGNTWMRSELGDGSGQIWGNSYAWIFWKLCLDFNEGDTYICRAIDETNTIQNGCVELNWNIRGIVNNSPHQI